MTSVTWTPLLGGVYVVAFGCAVFGVSIWRAKRKRQRVPQHFKLLRGPGESLRRKIAAFDEDFIPQLLGVSLIPGGVVVLALLSLVRWWPHMPLSTGLAITGFCALPFAVGAIWWASNRFLRRRDEALGYLGERAVGEALAPLQTLGFHVFHDIPADGAKKPFNVDHVVVGPSGVWAIETKTRRKGRARPGKKDHVVTYDGRQLSWPWAEDTFGLERAIGEAKWIRTFIQKRTGLDLTVHPVLALPGWWVEVQATGPVRVVNPKMIVPMIRSNGTSRLTADEIDLIARQFDDLCRDVED